MEAFEVVGQAHQVSFAADFLQASQHKLTETEHVFDDPEHRFDGAGAPSVARLTCGGFEFGGHHQEHRIGELFRRLDLVRWPPVVAAFGVGVLAVHADVKMAIQCRVVAAQAFEGGFVRVAAVGQRGGGRPEGGGDAGQAASVSPTSAAQVLTRWPTINWLPSASTTAWALLLWV